MNTTYTVTANSQLVAMNLSYYTLCRLADVLCCVNPLHALESRLTNPGFADMGWKGELTLDNLGNFVSFV